MPLPSSVLLGASPVLTIPSFSHETAGPSLLLFHLTGWSPSKHPALKILLLASADLIATRPPWKSFLVPPCPTRRSCLVWRAGPSSHGSVQGLLSRSKMPIPTDEVHSHLSGVHSPWGVPGIQVLMKQKARPTIICLFQQSFNFLTIISAMPWFLAQEEEVVKVKSKNMWSPTWCPIWTASVPSSLHKTAAHRWPEHHPDCCPRSFVCVLGVGGVFTGSSLLWTGFL